MRNGQTNAPKLVPVSVAPPPEAALNGAIQMLPSWLAVAWFVSKAQWFWNHQADLQFGWIVLLLWAFLVWEAWEKRPVAQARWNPLALGCMGVGLGLLFVVQIYQAAYGGNAASMVGLTLALTLVVAGNLQNTFGWSGLRHFGFAFAFLWVALPLPSVIYNLVVGGLQGKIASANVQLLNLFGIPAHRVGSLIRLPHCTVGVDEACSGIRSLQSTIMATLFIGYLLLGRNWLKLLLVGIGIALAVFGNLLRSLFLSYTASLGGPEALHRVHDTAGWSILAFTAAGVGLCAWAFATLERRALQMQRGPAQPRPSSAR